MLYFSQDKLGLNYEDLARMYPNTSFPSNEHIDGMPGIVSYEEVPIPEYDPLTEAARECPPENGMQKWEIYKLSDDLIKNNIDNLASYVRSVRASKLASTDWTQLPDAVVNSNSWAEYRQQLRDITLQPGFPRDVEWPEEPKD